MHVLSSVQAGREHPRREARATKALKTLGIEAEPLFSNGGLDANWLDKHGVPTITIGSGQAEIHTIKEYVNLAEFEKGCRIGVLMATLEE